MSNEKVEQLAANNLTIPQDAIASLLQRLVITTSLAANKLLKDLTMDEWKELHPAFEEDIYQAIASKQVVAARNSYGGTGFDQVRLAIADAKHLMD